MAKEALTGARAIGDGLHTRQVRDACHVRAKDDDALPGNHLRDSVEVVCVQRHAEVGLPKLELRRLDP